MAKILLLGIDDAIARKIEKASVAVNHSVVIEPMRSFDARPLADLVLVSGDQDNYLDTLRSIRSCLAPPPVIVVTRHPDTGGWLDALDAGAADYCSAPFDPKLIQWVLDSALQTATP